MKLSERMIEYRARERISQTELARRCGVSLQTICNIENETQKPNRVTVAKIELAMKGEKE